MKLGVDDMFTISFYFYNASGRLHTHMLSITDIRALSQKYHLETFTKHTKKKRNSELLRITAGRIIKIWVARYNRILGIKFSNTARIYKNGNQPVEQDSMHG